jgi:hypothetical protein
MKLLSKIMITAVACTAFAQTVEAKKDKVVMIKEDPKTYNAKWQYKLTMKVIETNKAKTTSSVSFNKKKVTISLDPDYDAIDLLVSANGKTKQITLRNRTGNQYKDKIIVVDSTGTPSLKDASRLPEFDK